jgi:hypothetical protein
LTLVKDITQTKLEEVTGEIKNQISSIMGRRFPSNPGKTLCDECDCMVIRHKINQICRVTNNSYFRLQKVDFDTPYIRLKIDFLV